MTRAPIETSLQQARDAVSRGAWSDAYNLLSDVDKRTQLSAEELENLGEAASWSAGVDATIEARERAYAAWMAAGNRRRAGGLALMLTRDHEHKLASKVAAGWMARAVRLPADEPESPEHGYLRRWASLQALSQGDYEGAIALAREAVEIGARQNDPNIQALGLMQEGAVLVRMGKVPEGMALMDEAMAAAVGGELDQLTTAIVYCNVISSCRDLTDYGRASEWTDAARRWCDRQAVHGFPGNCRVYRAEIMRLRGELTEARDEVLMAIDELRRFDLSTAACGLYELGEIRMRLGDMEGAEEAFREAHGLGYEPQPGLALLRLRDGKTAAAAAMIKQALRDESHDRLARARLLPPSVEIAIAAGDLETAREGAEELRVIAEEYATPALSAAAICAEGMVRLAEGDARAAVQRLRQALRLWNEADTPYEAARCRMTLAAAYDADGCVDDALLEYDAAASTFEKLGAMPDALKAADFAQALDSKRKHDTGAPGPRVTKTFMFTDIVSSTSLLEAMGDEAWENLLRWHDQTLRGLIVSHAGEEVKHEGDGFFIAFADAGSAAGCAVAIQRALAEHRRAHGFAPQVRIGLHCAEATQRGTDYSGKGIHETARIASLGGGGEILASAETVAALDSGITVSTPREVSLKGISRPVQVVAVEWR